MESEETRRNLPRLLFVLAALGYVVCTFVPWAAGVAVGRPVQYAAYEAGEGVWLVILAAVIGVLGVTGMVGGTSSRTLQLLPALVALVAAFMWAGANTNAGYAITFWRNEVGTGDYTFTRLVCLAAIGANGAAWFLLERWRTPEVRARTQPITRELGLNRWSLVTLAAASVLGVLGGVAGVAIVISSFGAKASVIALLVAVVSMFAGATIGIRLVRWVRTRVSRPA